MTKNETAKILAIIAVAYPRFNIDRSGIALNVWHELLQDIDYQIAQIAVQKMISESPYPPTIADIRKRAMEVKNPQIIDPAEAWGEVLDAVHAYGFYRQKEALESMSPEVRKVVGYIGWGEICKSEEPDVIRGQFLKMFSQVKEREEKEALLPEKLRNEIQALANRHNLRAIEGECYLNPYNIVESEDEQNA